MDDWDFLDEVDVISKWPEENKKAVLEGGKWSERKEGLEALSKLIETNPRLATSTLTIYGQLMDELRKILDRDSNIAVVVAAMKVTELLAAGLRTKFGSFVGMVFPFLIKRAKDKKKNVREAVAAALSVVASTTTSDRIQKDLIDGLGMPSPEVKQTILEFLYTYFMQMNEPDLVFIKALLPVAVKLASDSDVNVREKACMALGSAKRLLGSASVAFLQPLATETAKMEKIDQYEKQAQEEWLKENEQKAAKGQNHEENGGTENGSGDAAPSTASTASGPASIDPWQLLEPADVTEKLDKSVETQLQDKNWKERQEGCETIKKAMEGKGRIVMTERLREISTILIKIIEKDVNVNVASSSALILSALAKAVRYAFKPLAVKAFPASFEKLKDKKAIMRDALVQLVDSCATVAPLSSYIEAVNSGLLNKNPQSRAQTAAFLSRTIAKNDASTIEVDAVKEVAATVSKIANDADKEVREEALRCVAATSLCVGENVTNRLFADVFEDKLKADKIPTMLEELENTFSKSASDEMKRLAKENGGGSAKPAAPSAKPVSRPATASARPTGRPATATARSAARPTASSVRPASSKPTTVPLTAPSSVSGRPTTARPAPRAAPTIAPRVAVTRPVSSTVRTAPVVKPAPAPKVVPKPLAPAVRKPLTTTARPLSSKPAPVNVVRRPMTGVGSASLAANAKTTAATVSTSIARLDYTKVKPRINNASVAPNGMVRQSSGIPRPTGIPRPSSRQNSTLVKPTL